MDYFACAVAVGDRGVRRRRFTVGNTEKGIRGVSGRFGSFWILSTAKGLTSLLLCVTISHERKRVMKNYRYILFDLDGTLIYSHMGIFNGFRYALKAMGKEAPDDVYLRRCVGPSLMYSFQTFFGMDEETARVATAKYREIYAVQGVWENEPIEGVLEGLKRLKEEGYVLAMSTSKPLIYAEKIAERHGFSPYFSAEVGSGIDGSLPTKASVIEETMKRLKVLPFIRR